MTIFLKVNALNYVKTTKFNTRLMTQNTKKSRRGALHERFKIWVMFCVHWYSIAAKSNQKVQMDSVKLIQAFQNGS